MNNPATPSCGCPCHRMNGVFIALIGLIFLLGATETLSAHAVSIAWPVVLILMGLKNSMRKGFCKCCSDS